MKANQYLYHKEVAIEKTLSTRVSTIHPAYEKSAKRKPTKENRKNKRHKNT
jgi:hypothetical protein